jgi:hypothetical protein
VYQDKSYSDFMHAVRVRESSDNYHCVNKLGYLGAYQFGMARLSDFGLTVRTRPGSDNGSFEWRAPFSKEKFLASPMLQDAVFNLHVQDYVRRAAKKYTTVMGKTFGGVRVTLSGYVACCHLLGEGGFKQLVSGEDPKDAFGTSAKDYVKKFEGYEIPVAQVTLTTKELAKYVG